MILQLDQSLDAIPNDTHDPGSDPGSLEAIEA